MKYKIELKKIKEGRGTEETTNFYADVYIDGQLVAYAENTGKGGETDVRPHGKTEEQYKANNAKLNEVDSYFRSLPKEKVKGYSFEMQPSLVNHIDDMVDAFLNEKDRVKFTAKIKKNCLTSICYGTEKQYMAFNWKGMTIAEVVALANRSPKAALQLQARLQKVKSELKPGERVFNDNLGDFQQFV